VQILLLALTSCVVLAWAAPAEAHYFGLRNGKKCDPVQHAPRSDYASYDIKIRHIPGGCQRARHWLKTGNGGWRDVPTNHCRRRVHLDGLSHTDYRCTWPGTRKAMVWATS
jgi:hypothetical protein